MDNELICVRCGKLVEVYAKNYLLFERMHWLCFYLEFEHEADPDAPCNDPSCPQWHLEILSRRLREFGLEPNEVIFDAIEKRIQKD